MPATIKPTRADLLISRAIARHTNPPAERITQLVTWGADEHILCALAAGWWLWCRRRPAEQRRASNHILLTTAATTLLPHLLKTVIDQKRPDRLTVKGHLNGVPLTGNARDAFPSGHAVHIGALASAATRLPNAQRNVVWAAGAGLVLTRVILLAHWASDVVAGIAIGAALERSLRPVTGFGRTRSLKSHV
jgi:undecaprenyl-diphosphatase